MIYFELITCELLTKIIAVLIPHLFPPRLAAGANRLNQQRRDEIIELIDLFKIQDYMEKEIQDFASIPENALGEENTFDLRFLALQVKTGELANLTKCYKYNAKTPEISEEKLFLRALDAFQLLLSIGNVHQLNFITLDAIEAVPGEENQIKTFSAIFDGIAKLRTVLESGDYYHGLNLYIRLFAHYIYLARHLKIDFEKIYRYFLMRYPIPESLLEKTD